MKRLAIVLAVLALAGCKSTVTTTPDKPAPSGKTSSATPTKTTKPVAKVGSSITLKGNDDGEEVTVTVLKFVPTATSSDQYFKPAKGKRWVAIQFLLKDTGKTPYDDSPTNGSVVVDSEAQQYDADFGDSIKQGATFPAGVKIPVGGQAKGYVVYEVPKAAKITGVQFSLDSGFAATGQWVLG